nr:MAG TPA: hypothetical protein [Caudoviricetes sp.]
MIEIDNHTQACDELFQHLMQAMRRSGVIVGGSAGYPRAEIVSVNEQSVLDKGGEVRQVLVTIDSMSNKGLGEAFEINQNNLDRIKDADDSTSSYQILGVTEGNTTAREDMSDTQVVFYRVTNNLTFYLTKK